MLAAPPAHAAAERTVVGHGPADMVKLPWKPGHEGVVLTLRALIVAPGSVLVGLRVECNLLEFEAHPYVRSGRQATLRSQMAAAV